MLAILYVLVPEIFVLSFVTAYNVPLLVYVTFILLLFVLYHVFATRLVTLDVVHVLGVFPVPQLCTTTPLATVAVTLDLK